MDKKKFLILLVLLLVPFLVQVSDGTAQPITAVDVHSLGPQKIGPLPPAAIPPNNTQTTMKILLGKQLYFDTRLSKDNTISCATYHNPAMGW